MITAVLVRWYDASSVDCWTDITKIDAGDVDCHTIGFLVGETADAIFVSGSVNNLEAEHPDAACTMAIPKVLVKEIMPLGVIEPSGAFTV